MEVKLGFGAVPKPQYVFVSKEPDHCWYMLAEDERRIPIYEKALTGVITGIEVNKKVENTFGPDEKINLFILADKPYIIQSGNDTYFSKSLLLSLDALTSEQLRHPLTIAVSPGDKKVVFCNIYDPVIYRSVGVSWDEHREIDWQTLGQKVSLKVLIAQTDRYLAQLHWTPEQGRDYLQQKYGRRSRLQLSDTEILEFIDYLKLQLTQNCST
ncbi:MULTISPECIES: hypothetical protein [Nostoc]|uniref:Uncharacterized protein n=2 Tax=Nostoc TaxID=1177 RepID=A0ABR8I2T6_9NOSO|nr:MULTISPECIES: hypothetical protein [Nostoc]MBD2560005.1 hypothetical protein [Nostoc linckia FACHB-391]MBD2645665.1 hypothetical protein [Nostoc foliaceum FACHB-393]